MILNTSKVLLFWLFLVVFVVETVEKSQLKKEKNKNEHVEKVEIPITHRTQKKEQTKTTKKQNPITLQNKAKSTKPFQEKLKPAVKVETQKPQKVKLKNTHPITTTCRTTYKTVLPIVTTQIKKQPKQITEQMKPEKTKPVELTKKPTTHIKTESTKPVIHTQSTKSTDKPTQKVTSLKTEKTTRTTTETRTQIHTETHTQINTETHTPKEKVVTTTSNTKMKTEQNTPKPTKAQIKQEPPQSQTTMKPQIIREQPAPKIMFRPQEPIFQNRNMYNIPTQEPYTHHKRHHHRHHRHHHHHHKHRNHHTQPLNNNNMNYGMRNERYGVNFNNNQRLMTNANANNYGQQNRINNYGNMDNMRQDQQNFVENPGMDERHHGHRKHHHHHHHHKHKHMHQEPMLNVGVGNIMNRPQMAGNLAGRPIFRTIEATPINNLIKTRTTIKIQDNTIKLKPKTIAVDKKQNNEFQTKQTPIIKTLTPTLGTDKSKLNGGTDKKTTEAFSIKGMSKHLVDNIYDNTLGRFLNKKLSSKEEHHTVSCKTCDLHTPSTENVKDSISVTHLPRNTKSQTTPLSVVTKMKNAANKLTSTTVNKNHINVVSTMPQHVYLTTKITPTVTSVRNQTPETIKGRTTIKSAVTQTTKPNLVIGEKLNVNTNSPTTTHVILTTEPSTTALTKSKSGNPVVTKHYITYKPVKITKNVTIDTDEVQHMDEVQIHKPETVSTTQGSLRTHNECTTIDDSPDSTTEYVLSEQKATNVNNDSSQHPHHHEVHSAEYLQSHGNKKITTEKLAMNYSDVHTALTTYHPGHTFEGHVDNITYQTDYHDNFEDHENDTVHDIHESTHEYTTENEHIDTTTAYVYKYEESTAVTTDDNMTTVLYDEPTWTYPTTTERDVEVTTNDFTSSTTESSTQTTTLDYYSYRQRQRNGYSTQYNPYGGSTTDYFGNRWGRSTTEETTTDDMYSETTTENSHTTTTVSTNDETTVKTSDEINHNEKSQEKIDHLTDETPKDLDTVKSGSVEKHHEDGDTKSHSHRKAKKLRRRHHSRHHHSHVPSSNEETTTQMEDDSEEYSDGNLHKAWSFIYNSWIMQKMINTLKNVTHYICGRLKSTIWKAVHKKVKDHLSEDDENEEQLSEQQHNHHPTTNYVSDEHHDVHETDEDHMSEEHEEPEELGDEEVIQSDHEEAAPSGD